MKILKVGLVVLLLGMGTSTALGKTTLKLSTTFWPPYTNIEDTEYPGTLVEIVREVFALMDQDISIKSLPWKRALNEVEIGIADAAFGAAYTEERYVYSIYPKDYIGLLTYVFFIPAEKKDSFVFNSYEDLKDIRIGAVGGAAVNKIEEFHEAGKKYNNVYLVTGQHSVESNPLILQSNRTDCYAEGLLTGLAMLKVLRKKGLLTKEIIPYKKKPIQVTELYLIFSKKAGYTDQHPLVLNFTSTLKKFKNSEKYELIMKKYEKY